MKEHAARPAKENIVRGFLRTHRDGIITVLSVLVIYGFFFTVLHVTCPIKEVTGVSCPGCGMTRAWLALLQWDVRSAWGYHPLFLLPPIWLGAYCLRERHPGLYRMVTVAGITAMLVVYAVRMLDPSDQIVVFQPREGGACRLFALVIDMM